MMLRKMDKFFYYIFLVVAPLTGAENDRPIIGILAQEAPHGAPGDTYVPWNYVVYIESAGARVAPIRVKESDKYYQEMFSGINGLLFPGGMVDLVTSEYAKAGRKLYDMALKANDEGDHFPLWGTCQGFEFLSVTTANAKATADIMRNCTDMDISIPANPKPGARQSEMLKGMSDDVYYAMTHWNITANFHNWCLLPEVYAEHDLLRNNFTVLTTNLDKNDTEFISMMQGKKYPIFGTQFHPEKNNMLWNTHFDLNHSALAVQMSQYFADFFVGQARQSFHKFDNLPCESECLIYNYQYHYSGQPNFTLDYYFNYTRNQHFEGCPCKPRTKIPRRPSHYYHRHDGHRE